MIKVTYDINDNRNYSLKMLSNYQKTLWTHLSFSTFHNFLESAGLDRNTIFELLPVNFKGVIWESLEVEDFNFINSITTPMRCLEIMKKYNLLELAALHKPDLLYKLTWLQKRWEKGCHIFVNC